MVLRPLTSLATARARVLRAGGLELDPLRRTVTRDSRPITTPGIGYRISLPSAPAGLS